jgi:uncharacterized protein
MSELINNSQSRKELLKHMILQLHEGVAPEAVKLRLMELMSKVPYGEVVEVEQELISEGLPEDEVLRLCDIHTEVLEGKIDLTGMKIVAPGHPVDTFKRENRELEKVVAKIHELIDNVAMLLPQAGTESYINQLKAQFNALADADKHYRRKENLLFPFLERYGITGPPKVMWGKHDETRDLLAVASGSLDVPGEMTVDALKVKAELYLLPAAKAITDMIMKEEEILLPMTLDKLTETDWYEIYRQTNEIGYCLYDPQVEWKPQGIKLQEATSAEEGQISLPSGKFSPEELLAILNTLPVDITFVDRDDKVKYFSQGKERIFDRNRAILGRDVRMCHPPSSVHVVDQIISDFRNGKADSAPFWIQMQGKFIHIEYFALRNEKGEYLGTLEVSQDLAEKRKLSGDQRILSYKKSDSETKQKETMNGPSWFDKAKVKISLDARPLLAQGIHPLEQVMKEAAGLAAGEIFEIITPFPPSPMIEKMAAAGYDTWSVAEEGVFRTWFYKK